MNMTMIMIMIMITKRTLQFLFLQFSSLELQKTPSFLLFLRHFSSSRSLSRRHGHLHWERGPPSSSWAIARKASRLGSVFSCNKETRNFEWRDLTKHFLNLLLALCQCQCQCSDWCFLFVCVCKMWILLSEDVRRVGMLKTTSIPLLSLLVGNPKNSSSAFPNPKSVMVTGDIVDFTPDVRSLHFNSFHIYIFLKLFFLFLFFFL